MNQSPGVEQGIGGLAIDASNLELQVALLLAVALDEDWPFVQGLMGTAGGVMRGLDRLIDGRSDGLGDDLRRLRDDAQTLRAQRNDLIHSVTILAFDRSATGPTVALLNPARRSLTSPTTEELLSLRHRTQALAARCVKLAEQFASAQDGERDSVRA